MRILVTGGAGYVGSHTVALLHEHGHDVTVVDDLSTGHRAAVPNGTLIECALTDRPRLDDILQSGPVEVVIHFAASCYVGESVAHPAKYYANNIGGTLSLLDAMRTCGVPAVIVSSSCAVYGIPSQLPITEDTPQQPVNPYGFTKLAMERALQDYGQAYGLGSVALRYFNAAGASADARLGEDHDPETHLIPLALRTASGRHPHIPVFGVDYPTADGTCIRDYVHVSDLAEAHVRALDHVKPGALRTFNLGTGKGHSVRDVIDRARAITGRPVPVLECPRRPGDPPELVCSGDKARRELGWSPVHGLDSMIASAWRWHQRRPDGY